MHKHTLDEANPKKGNFTRCACLIFSACNFIWFLLLKSSGGGSFTLFGESKKEIANRTSCSSIQFSLFGYHTMYECMCTFYRLGLISLLFLLLNRIKAVESALFDFLCKWRCCCCCCCCRRLMPQRLFVWHCRFLLLLFVFIDWQTTHKHAPHFRSVTFKKRSAHTKKITFNTRAYQLIATSPSIELNWQQIASTIYYNVLAQWIRERKEIVSYVRTHAIVY